MPVVDFVDRSDLIHVDRAETGRWRVAVYPGGRIESFVHLHIRVTDVGLDDMADTINAEPLARLQYVSCADPQTLQEIEGGIQGRALLSMAVFVGKTRLIDNILLEG